MNWKKSEVRRIITLIRDGTWRSKDRLLEKLSNEFGMAKSSVREKWEELEVEESVKNLSDHVRKKIKGG